MKNTDYYKAGFSQRDISPDFPVELVGCYREDPIAIEILDPLTTQVLLFKGPKGYYCLVSIDSLGLTVDLSNELRKIIANELNTHISRIMLNFSHTHSAPNPLSSINGSRYFQLLCNKVMEAVKEATNNLQLCFVSWDVEEVDFAENRRDGCSIVDKRLGALKIFNENGIPILLLLRISSHANILMSESKKISSDYFGMTRRKIGYYFNCPVMILQGSSGNLKPINVDKINGGNIDDIERISNIILEAAKSLDFIPSKIFNLTMFEREIVFYSDIPSEKEALQIVNNGRTLYGIDGNSWLDEYYRLKNSGITIQKQYRNIQYLFINEGCFCGLPDELFCEIALEASKATNSLLFLNGYTNGTAGYIPNEEEWKKGGYETLYSFLTYYIFHNHIMPFRKNTSLEIQNSVISQWKEYYN